MNKLFSIFAKSNKIQGEDYQFYNITYYGYILAGLTHAVFLIFFWFIDLKIMAYFNIFSLMVFVSAFILNNYHKLNTAFILVITEVLIHAALSIYFLGFLSGFQYYLFALSTIVVFMPKWNYTAKITFIGTLVVLMLVLRETYYVGTFDFSGEGFWGAGIQYINVTGSFLMFALIAYYYDNAVKQTKKQLIDKNEKLDKLNSELKYANDSKDKFFSIIAHDLKNPLSAIYMNSELLSIYFEQFPPEQLKDNIDKLHASSTHLKEFLDNLLEWARAQTNGISYEPEETNINELVENNISLLQSHANDKQLEINANLTDNLNLMLDQNMINTVVRNLTTNAIKFTPEGGNIIISTEKINQNIRVSIEDSGVGISPENLEKLFRIDTTISTKGTSGEKGTGLGLLLCKEFVEKHGGKINVKSDQGKGSKFYFDLPL